MVVVVVVVPLLPTKLSSWEIEKRDITASRLFSLVYSNQLTMVACSLESII